MRLLCCSMTTKWAFKRSRWNVDSHMNIKKWSGAEQLETYRAQKGLFFHLQKRIYIYTEQKLLKIYNFFLIMLCAYDLVFVWPLSNCFLLIFGLFLDSSLVCLPSSRSTRWVYIHNMCCTCKLLDSTIYTNAWSEICSKISILVKNRNLSQK